MKSKLSQSKVQKTKTKIQICAAAQDTFDLGEKIGESLRGGEILLLRGGLGAGKTLLTKGILHGLNFNVDEVNSPSFTLVNLYKTEKFDVFHIDLWRLNENSDAGFAVGLNEILEDENSIAIIEWSERLKEKAFARKIFLIEITGDGDDKREISILENES